MGLMKLWKNDMRGIIFVFFKDGFVDGGEVIGIINGLWHTQTDMAWDAREHSHHRIFPCREMGNMVFDRPAIRVFDLRELIVTQGIEQGMEGIPLFCNLGQ